MHDGGIAKLLERLDRSDGAAARIGDCLMDGERWGTVSGGMGFDEVMIATCSQPELAGLHLAELARQTGKAPAEALMDLLLEERCTSPWSASRRASRTSPRCWRIPRIMIGSDSIPLPRATGPKPASRTRGPTGRSPRARRYARERGLFSLETAVHKMTGMPAASSGLQDRGWCARASRRPRRLRSRHGEGRGDVPGRTAIRSASPTSIVNGAVVVDGPRYNAIPAGRVLTPA